jgi:imidazolonepropionase
MLLDVTRERPAVLPADRATLLIEHASELATLGGVWGDGPRGGLWQGDPGLIHDGAIAIGGDGRILAVGPTSRVRDAVDLSPKVRIVDASGCAIIPGLFDAYTELIVPVTPEDRTRGRSMARRTRPAADPLAELLSLSEREFVARLWRRLDAVLVRGTTGLAMTSGYGLDVDDELHLLRAIQAMTEVGPLAVAASFRAGDRLPTAYEQNASAYVDALSHDLLPDAADEELAGSLAFAADQTMLTIEQGWRVLRAAQSHGLRRRLDLSAASHPGILDLADEMGVSAVVLRDEPSDATLLELADMNATAVIPVGVPNATEWGKRCARRLIEFGVPLALGTGQVPLGDLSGTPLDILRLACCQLGLTPAEALVATTVNAAFASGLGEDVGSLEPGKRADLLILNVPSYARLPYHSSADPIRAVIKDGWVVVEEGRRVA